MHSFTTGFRRVLPAFALAAISWNVARAGLEPNGVLNDDQTSIVYSTTTGELAIDAMSNRSLSSINIDSLEGVFTQSPAENMGGSFDNDHDHNIFKATFGGTFDSLSFGNVAQPGLDMQFLLNDITVVGSLGGGGQLGPVDLVFIEDGVILLDGRLFNGSFSSDENVDRSEFDFGSYQLADPSPEMTFQVTNLGFVNTELSENVDLVSVQYSGDTDRFVTNVSPFSDLEVGGTRSFTASLDTYQTGRFRSWVDLQLMNSTDPGKSEVLRLELNGRVTAPPAGRVLPEGAGGKELPLISYNSESGELFLTSPIDLTAINISSASGVFTGLTPGDVLDGSFDVHQDGNIFKATFGDSFGNLSFGPIVQTGLSTEFLMNDLTITGSKAGGGSLDNVFFSRILALPEPGSCSLAVFGIGILLTGRSRARCGFRCRVD